jgi:hypothetical protein
MPARFSAYPPDRAALVQVLDEGVVYRIGRGADCELRIDHPSVSRYHAELRGSADGGAPRWKLHDTGSKNGLRVEGHLALNVEFAASTWFAVGDVYCWLEPLDAAAAAALREQSVRRRAASRELSARFVASRDLGTLIPQALDVALELSGLERGFVLYAPAEEPLRVRACRGLAIDDLAKASFSGSAAAVERALASRAPVVCCDTADTPWLGLRPSVRLGGIRALVCVPLQVGTGGRGVVYLDSHKPGPPVTELDIELIDSVAQHAAAALAAGDLQGEVRDLLRDERLDELAPRWDELRSL